MFERDLDLTQDFLADLESRELIAPAGTELKKVIELGLCSVTGVNNYLGGGYLPDGTSFIIVRYLYTVAIVANVDRAGYSYRWCYNNWLVMRIALVDWLANWETLPEPTGWTANKSARPFERKS